MANGAEDGDDDTVNKAAATSADDADANISNDSFVLFADNDKSLIDAYDYVCQASLSHIKVCVVSVIGKDSSTSPSSLSSIKANLINIILDQNHAALKLISNTCSSSKADDANIDCETQVSALLSKRAKVVVLYLSSFLDTNRLLALTKQKKRLLQDQNLFQAWPRLNQNLVKTLLIIYLMSHIIVIYHPEPQFDYQLIETFQVLEDLRQRSQPRICESLASLAAQQKFPSQWVRNGRLCCPRVLFVCDASHHPAFSHANITKQAINKLERQMEDHIYRLLKKMSIITTSKPSSDPNDTLMHVPPKDDFVFIITRHDVSTSMTDYKQRNASHFYDQLLSVMEQQLEDCAFENKSVYTPLNETYNHQDTDSIKPFKKRFKYFVRAQIDQALKLNNVQHQRIRCPNQRVAGHRTGGNTDMFVLPRFDDFFLALREVKNVIFAIPEMDETAVRTELTSSPRYLFGQDERRFIDIYDHYDVDRRFSRSHCEVIIAAALELYQRGLPRQYSRDNHEKKLEQAKQFYTTHAFGDSFESCLITLVNQCNQTWTNGRQLRATRDNHNDQQIPGTSNVNLDSSSKGHSKSKGRRNHHARSARPSSGPPPTIRPRAPSQVANSAAVATADDGKKK